MAGVEPPRPRHGSLARQAIGLAVVAGLAFVIGVVAQEWRFHRTGDEPQNELALAKSAYREGDNRAALTLFTKLADKHDAVAEYWLAHMTELGIGVAPNPAKAVTLYKKAAAQGNVPAERRLGEIYLEGDIVPPNFGLAKTYLEKAALRGDIHAATSLSRIYRLGLGRSADPVEAYSWLEVAVLEGSVLAEHERNALLASLSPAQQKTAITRAKYLMAKIDGNTKVASSKPAHSAHGKEPTQLASLPTKPKADAKR